MGVFLMDGESVDGVVDLCGQFKVTSSFPLDHVVLDIVNNNVDDDDDSVKEIKIVNEKTKGEDARDGRQQDCIM